MAPLREGKKKPQPKKAEKYASAGDSSANCENRISGRPGRNTGTVNLSTMGHAKSD